MRHEETVPESLFAKHFAEGEVKIDFLAHLFANHSRHGGQQRLLARSVGRMWAVAVQVEKSEGCRAGRDPSSRISQARTVK
jgi:hypothetical protein